MCSAVEEKATAPANSHGPIVCFSAALPSYTWPGEPPLFGVQCWPTPNAPPTNQSGATSFWAPKRSIEVLLVDPDWVFHSPAALVQTQSSSPIIVPEPLNTGQLIGAASEEGGWVKPSSLTMVSTATMTNASATAYSTAVGAHARRVLVTLTKAIARISTADTTRGRTGVQCRSRRAPRASSFILVFPKSPQLIGASLYSPRATVTKHFCHPLFAVASDDLE